MRFKKGCKAEVMNKEVQKAWCVADKGEKVSKRGVKPSPPAIGSQNFVAGDVVEVFDEGIWKVATVSKILKEGRFLVRPHGFAYEIKAHKTNIRPRQSWGDGQRVPVGKISGSKRSSPFCSSFLDAKKVKRAEKDGGQGQSQRRVSGHSSQKVDAFEGNKYNNLNGFYETEKRKTYGVGCDLTRISEPNESDNDECSVGSCSVPSDGHGPNKLSSHYDADGLSSDGESFNTSRVKHEVAASIHRLELHAYRSTLEALYASGPLSWEKEALLTNLRINLNISNDEHLTKLRHLISSGSRILD
ncbi:uncharacterized protein LOC143637655 isoform X1 [Bidens hawaiensis]|uniref:uncharacterized protein LOC143637655 isoform X1 n=1 Tax=Bidens hawaiensis TaxID=980011 RepID=UPI00404B0BC1